MFLSFYLEIQIILTRFSEFESVSVAIAWMGFRREKHEYDCRPSTVSVLFIFIFNGLKGNPFFVDCYLLCVY